MGGNTATGMGNDVWYSTDGTDWIGALSQSPWSVREGFTCTAFAPTTGPQAGVSQMWVIGGQDFDGNVFNDAWSSTDGIHWTSQTSTSPLPERSFHQCLAYNGKLWVMGGRTFSGFPDDVWSSTDGANWTQETSGAAGPRLGFVAGVENGEMVVSGGVPTGLGHDAQVVFNDVYHSADGVNWTPSTYNASFPGRYDSAALSDAQPSMVLRGTIQSFLSQRADQYLMDAWYSNYQQAPAFTPTFTPSPDANAVWTQGNSDPGLSPGPTRPSQPFKTNFGCLVGRQRHRALGGCLEYLRWGGGNWCRTIHLLTNKPIRSS